MKKAIKNNQKAILDQAVNALNQQGIKDQELKAVNGGIIGCPSCPPILLGLVVNDDPPTDFPYLSTF